LKNNLFSKVIIPSRDLSFADEVVFGAIEFNEIKLRNGGLITHRVAN
jgi:hypothetical protein